MHDHISLPIILLQQNFHVLAFILDAAILLFLVHILACSSFRILDSGHRSLVWHSRLKHGFKTTTNTTILWLHS